MSIHPRWQVHDHTLTFQRMCTTLRFVFLGPQVQPFVDAGCEPSAHTTLGVQETCKRLRVQATLTQGDISRILATNRLLSPQGSSYWELSASEFILMFRTYAIWGSKPQGVLCSPCGQGQFVLPYKRVGSSISLSSFSSCRCWSLSSRRWNYIPSIVWTYPFPAFPQIA